MKNKEGEKTARFGLPSEIKFCKKCVMPNTRPSSCNEYTHTISREHSYIEFDEDGVCSACRYNEAKENNKAEQAFKIRRIAKNYRHHKLPPSIN